MKKLARILFIVAVLALVALPTFAQSSTAEPNMLVMARAADATGLDPHTQTAFASFRLLELIYEPLVNLDANLNVVPALAESWEFSSDGLTLTFHLRQNVKFHDGSPFSSADVIASFTRILDPATKDAAASNYASIKSMEAPDANTVVFHLSQPDAPILPALASVNASIVPAAMAKSGDFKATADGTGPFELTQWTPDQETILTSNKDWWGGAPSFDGIDIRIIPDETSIVAAMRAGTVDFAILNDPTVATQLENDSTLQLNKVGSLSYNVLQLNPSRPPMDKLEVRQAISCAIDRQQVLDTASLSEGKVTGPITSPAYQIPTSDLFCYTPDLDKAKSLLAQAGESGGFSLGVIAATTEPPYAEAEAENIQSQLAQIGITLNIEKLEDSVYVDRWLKGDFDTAVALNGGRPDPYTMYARYFTNNGNLQVVSNFKDDTIDGLLTQGRAETDPAKRLDIFTQFQKQITEDSPWIWLYQSYDYTAQQKYVTGFVPNPSDSILSIAQVKLDKPAS
ncbi:MAG TPA: ABC transporter substrate-binding protein [Phototrophicaceae bacterium]|nr:ABC transporter substrate-binding protein [Phototrophicaceae bacterium]